MEGQMPAVTMTVMPASGRVTVTETTLNGTDSLTYIPSAGQVLILRNPTGASITPVIDGAGGTTVNKPGLGQVSVAAGYSVGAIGAGAAAMVSLDVIADYLQGAVAINSGSGLVASLIRPTR
jgi:hypothetical protein